MSVGGSSLGGRVASILLEETFSSGVRLVGTFMMRKGAVPLRTIVQGLVGGGGGELTTAVVQDALKTMMQHSLVTFTLNPLSGEPIYEVDVGRVMELIRFPRYFAVIEKSMGPLARKMVEEVVQVGQLSASRLVYICACRAKEEEESAEITETEMYNKLVTFQDTLVALVARKVLMIVPPPVLSLSEEEEEQKQGGSGGVNRELFVVPTIDKAKLLEKLMGEKEGEVDLDSLQDSKTLWSVNVSQLQALWRNDIVATGLQTKFGDMVDPRIFHILMEFGFDKHPWENEGTPVKVPELKDKIEKMSDGMITSKFLPEYLEIIEDDPMRLLTKLSTTLGGHYSFNMKIAITELFWSMIDRCVVEKHGYQALRIFRLVRTNSYVEQEEINELGMIPSKEAKHLTYKLVEDRFISIKEVKKSYAVSAPPGKVGHLFYINPPTLITALHQQCYKTILNLKQRYHVETDKVKTLLVKNAKLDKILTNMKNKGCTEAQIEEMKELLTPPERTVLQRYDFSMYKLLSASMQVDETLFISELFLRYQQVKRKVTKGRKGGGVTSAK